MTPSLPRPRARRLIAAARTDVSASPSALSGRSGGFSVTYAATTGRRPT